MTAADLLDALVHTVLAILGAVAGVHDGQRLAINAMTNCEVTSR